jgi:hypothetical protein
VVLSGLPEVVVEDVEADLYFAIDRAADRAGRTVMRKIGRKQTLHTQTPAGVGLGQVCLTSYRNRQRISASGAIADRGYPGRFFAGLGAADSQKQ